MRFEHDPQADAIYITLRDVPYAFGEDLDVAHRVDYGPDQRPRGVELLSVSRGVDLTGLPGRDAVERLLAEHRIPVLAR